MIPQPKNNAPKPPDESAMRLMLENNMADVVQSLIDLHKLQYKISLREGKWILEDSVKGADLWLKKFITEDPDMIRMKDEVKKLAKIDDEVLILGETGTGKELIARALIGDREAPFLRINCAAMPKELIESELFGHKKGAFTGAETDKKGMMVAAGCGVLFLDEIGDLPLETQAKILNALQPVDGKRYVRPVGSNAEIEIGCRVVCATHRDLKSMVKDGKFRIDLYARISTFELLIKPVRERKCDIIPIVKEIGFLIKQESAATRFIEEYMDDIINGEIDLSLNVRSLEQCLKRYAILGRI
jgi:transcriptional regulator with GAF, ATPase, and Fis domain